MIEQILLIITAEEGRFDSPEH